MIYYEMPTFSLKSSLPQAGIFLYSPPLVFIQTPYSTVSACDPWLPAVNVEHWSHSQPPGDSHGVMQDALIALMEKVQ